MSDSLDEQLFEAMYPGLLDGEPLDMQQLMWKRRQPRIEAIKQAFKDAGYIDAASSAIKLEFEPGARMPTREDGKELMPDTFMTGQEWESWAFENGWVAPPHRNVTQEQVSQFAGEEVRPVEGHSGKYWVSISGKIFSTAWGKVKEKKMNYYHDGYARVSLSTGQTGLVHRLVAAAWINNLDNRSDVNHLDGNKGNNAVSNLEWATRSENMNHAFNTGLIISRKGSKNSNAKLTEADVKAIIERLNRGETGTALAAEFGVAHGRIYDLKNGRGWKHVTIELEAAKRAAGIES
jgi:hypothetical protein